MTAIAWNAETHDLAIAPIDAEHRAVIAALKDTCTAPTENFAEAFQALSTTIRAHFRNEEALMAQSGHKDNEHLGEHRRILGEMALLSTRVEKGRTQIARAFVADRLGAWLDIHIQTLDSAFAAHLRRVGFIPEYTPEPSLSDDPPAPRTSGTP